ncbi:AAA family ATPase [Aurantiacibacter luteus]|uniref:AAA domain-containing protein n=1 Tax=Aurantiacibacter luteus TaxID=1581420 RepID=A0A0G9MPL2_9SPHN|nr:hypothetical protein [Aurantiacibacter luteus]KLE31233.1 hypothetical protein AAW00_13775 [Aurantiacibacter luteus]
MKDTLNLDPETATGFSIRTVLACDPAWLAAAGNSAWTSLPDLRTCAVGPRDAVPSDILRHADVLVLEVDAGNPASLDRLESVKRARPDLPVIAAVENADIALMRALLRHGISDVAALPLEPEALGQQVNTIGTALASHGPASLAPSVCVIGALGRSGASAVLLHLADEMARRSPTPIRCCVIDLDLQAGHLAAYAGVDTQRSVLSLLEAEQRLDGDMVRNIASRVRDGVYLISAPTEIVPIEQVETEQLLKIVSLAQAEFDLVLIDLPAAWTNWSLSVAAESDRIVMVVEQSLANLRQARRCLDLFRDVGIGQRSVDVIVNRANKSRFSSITVQDVADTLGRDVVATVREDKGELAQALDAGRLVSQGNRKNPFALDVGELADGLLRSLAGGRQ